MRYEIHRLGNAYYGVWDSRTEMYVKTSSDEAVLKYWVSQH